MSNDSSDQVSADVQGSRKAITSRWVAPFSLVTIVVLFYAAQMAGALALLAIGKTQGVSAEGLSSWVNDSIGWQFVYLLISESLLLLGLFGLLRILRWGWKTIGLTKPKLKHIGIGAAAVVPYYIIYIAVVAVVSRYVPGFDTNQKQEIGFDSAVTVGQLLVTFVSLVIIPPFVEELAMRGYLYSGLRTWFPKIASALAVSAVFGAAHLSGGGAAGPLWIGAVDTFVLSLVLVFLREKTGSLWASITLHGLKNFIAFMLVFVLHAS